MLEILQNTFLHVPGVGKNTEVSLWSSKILTWQEFIDKKEEVQLGRLKKERIHSHIKRSISAYNKKQYDFFVSNLPSNLHWRAYPELKDKCCFLDIETTGLDKYRDEITVIGLYNGKESKIFVNGKDLEKFQDEIKKYPMIVTFNGRCFDVPFIKAKFPDVDLDKFHIDLRFAMAEIGFRGGLKRIEKEVGISRPDDLGEIDGFEAVRLWYKYESGDKEALDTLIRYNKEDIQNLKFLMDFTFDRLKEKSQDF